MNLGRLKIAGGLLMAVALAACSGTDGPQGPGPMLADNACAQLRADLNSMDKRGVPGMIDARNNGKKFAPAQDGEINRYNQVLDQYLGGQCASEARYKQKTGIQEKAPGSSRRASAESVSGANTGSIPKTQVKRRKPVNDDDQSSVKREEKAATADEAQQEKPARRRPVRTSDQKATAATSSTTPSTTASIPAPTPVKADSGLPTAPPPVKAESAAAKDDGGDKRD